MAGCGKPRHLYANRCKNTLSRPPTHAGKTTEQNDGLSPRETRRLLLLTRSCALGKRRLCWLVLFLHDLRCRRLVGIRRRIETLGNRLADPCDGFVQSIDQRPMFC